MISEKDKQAILNGAYGVTRRGRKVKYLGCNTSKFDAYPHKFITFDENNQMDNKLLNLKFSKARGFYVNPIDNSLNDIVGLWQDKPEPFDLERALRGYPVILRGGLKAFIKFKLPKTSTSTPYIGYYENEVHNCVEHCWDKNGMCEPISRNETSLDIVGMWKEPEPLSSNSLQLPKPLTSPPTEKAYYFISAGLTFADSAYVVVETTWDNDHGDRRRLACGRIYASKKDAIKVIEAITGKPYEKK